MKGDDFVTLRHNRFRRPRPRQDLLEKLIWLGLGLIVAAKIAHYLGWFQQIEIAGVRF